MKKVAPWLLPTLLGPIVGACVYVAAVAATVSLPIPIPTFVWVVAAAVASGFAFAVGMVMVATDMALLKLQLRQPPTGWRAWLMGVVAPIPVLFTWQKLAKFAIGGLPQLLVTFLLPMLVIALVARIALGTRPANWSD